MSVPIHDRPGRRLVLRVLLVCAVAATLWGLVLLGLGGFDRNIAGIRIRSNNPSRVLTAAGLLLVIYVALGGPIRVPWRPIAAGSRRLVRLLAGRPAWTVAAIAVASSAMGVAFGARAANASDAWGYVSQAQLWLNLNLKIPQPWAAEVPWVEKIQSFAPLGYRPAPGANEWAIVPVYSPGVPIMLAAAKALIGDWGLYLVIPIFGALSVVATYRFGRRLASPWASVGAAWLIATTPAAVAVLMEPLTDVPAMAMWTFALAALLGRGRWAMARAGLLASAAVLIRPNLVILAGPMALWPLLRRDGDRDARFTSRVLDCAVFSACASLGAIAIATLATYLYGSPFESGYGPASYLYSWTRVLPNLPRYFGWYVESHTPVAVLGMIALVVPLRALWPDAPDRRGFPVLLLFNVALWLLYASYFEYDSWGFLRFLIPGWPILMLGTVVALTAVVRTMVRPPVLAAAITAVTVAALGAWQLHFAHREGMFNQRAPSRHEILIGPLVKAHTDPNSVVLTIQRSGSLRYYAGRVTLRYDRLDPTTLDRDLAWLHAHGVSAYALLDTHEVEEFRRRFATQKASAVIDTPALIYEPGALRLFDLTPGAVSGSPITISTIPPDRFDVVAPEPLPSIVLRR